MLVMAVSLFSVFSFAGTSSITSVSEEGLFKANFLTESIKEKFFLVDVSFQEVEDGRIVAVSVFNLYPERDIEVMMVTINGTQIMERSQYGILVGANELERLFFDFNWVEDTVNHVVIDSNRNNIAEGFYES